MSTFRITTAYVLAILFFLQGVTPAVAAVMESTNYKLQADSVNIGGGRSSSTNYTLEDTAGEVGTGTSSSTNYQNNAGYQQMVIGAGGGDATAPSVPANLTATVVSQTRIDLSWDASTDNVGVSGYRVKRDGVHVATTTGTTYNDTGLSVGTTYSYTVSAFDAAVNISAESDSVSATTVVVNQIASAGSATESMELVSLEVVPSLTTAYIRWKSNYTSLGVLSYGETNEYELGVVETGETFKNTHEVVLTNLRPGRTYFFKVEAKTVGGKVVTLTTSSFTTRSAIPSSADDLKPLNVSNFRAEVDGDNVRLVWQNPQEDDYNQTRIVRGDDFYPEDPEDGEVIYQGSGEMHTDLGALTEHNARYYTAFVSDQEGNVSSGAVVRVRKEGDEIFIDSDVPLVSFEEIGFFQDGQTLTAKNGIITLDASKVLTLALPYEALPEHLKTITVELQNEAGEAFSFLLRVNDEKSAYLARVAPLGKAGAYPLSLSIFDFKEGSVSTTKGRIDAELPVARESSALLAGFTKRDLIVGAGTLLVLTACALLFLMKLCKFYGRRVAGGLILLIVCVTLGAAEFARAAFNTEINYQAKLLDSGGSAVSDGNYDMEFSLYTAASGGTAVWTETRTGGNQVAVTDGLFSVMLGDITSLASLNFDRTLYLGVTIGSDSEMTPRKVLGAVPAAFEADKLDGFEATQFLRSDAADTLATSTTSTLLTINQSGTGDILNLQDNGTEVFTVLDGGNIGIGNKNPSEKLNVQGELAAQYFTATSTSATSTFAGGLTVDTSDFVVDPDAGRVGIGTTTPQGTLTVHSGQLTLPSGAVGAPSLTFNDDIDTGFYRAGSGEVRYSSNGTGEVTIYSGGVLVNSGNIFGFNQGAVGSTIDVKLARTAAGVLSLINGTDAQEFRVYNTDNGADDEFASIGFINNSNVFGIQTEAEGVGTIRNIALLGGNVGIGSTTPAADLGVTGSGFFDGTLTFSSFTATSTTATSTIRGGLEDDLGDFVLSGQNNSGDVLLNPYFTTSNVGYVGIGTSTPMSDLSVRGRSNNGNGAELVLAPYNAPSYYVSLNGTFADRGMQLALGGHSIIETAGFDNPDIIKFFTHDDGAGDSTEKLRIAQNGNVGIGNKNPSEKLNVQGELAAQYFTATSTSATSTFSGGLTIETTGFVYDFGSNTVGIGTDQAPVFNGTNRSLVIGDGTTNYGMTFYTSNSTAARIAFNDTASASNQGLIRYEHGDNSLDFFTNSSQAMTIDSSQRVGIGTTTPDEKLNIYGTGNLALSIDSTNNAYLDIHSDVDNDGNQDSTIRLNEGNSSRFALGYDGDLGIFSIDNGGALGSDNFLTIESAGQVGIGTTTPDFTLDVDGDFRAQTISTLNTGATHLTLTRSGTTSGGPDINLANSAGTMARINVNGNGDFQFISDPNGTQTDSEHIWYIDDVSTQRAVLTTSGFGINLAGGNPAFRLEAQGTSGSGYFGLTNSSDGDIFIVDGSGEVGIGTTTPSALLAVAGSAFFDGGTITTASLIATSTLTVNASTTFNGVEYLFPSADGSSGQALTTNGAGGLSWTSVSGAPSGTTGQTITYNGSNTAFATSSLFVAQTERVGVATTSPWAQLSVEGQGVNPAFVVSDTSNNADFVVDASGNVGIGTFSLNEVFEIQSSAGETGMILSTPNPSIWLTDSSDANKTWALYNQGSNDRLAFVSVNDDRSSSSNERMVIEHSTGDVGIGTDSPERRLHVAASVDSDYVAVIQNTRSNDQSADVLELRGGSNSNLANTVYIALSDGDGTEHAWIQGAADSADKGIAINTTGENANDFVISEIGNIGIGDADPEAFALQISDNTTDQFSVQLNDSSASPYGFDIDFSAASPDNNTNIFMRFQDSTTDRLIIYSDGDVVNHDNSYGAISDITLKENIANAPSYLSDLMDVQVREYSFIEDGLDEANDVGVIAQELETVFPDLVITQGDGTKAVAYSKFTPIIMKSLQELVGSLNITGALTASSTLVSNYAQVGKQALTIDASGNFAIGTTTPTSLLHVEDTTFDTDLLTLTDADGTCVMNPEAGSLMITCSSDQKLKKSITTVPDTYLDDMLSIRLHEYTPKASPNERMIGTIAQEMLIDMPEWVSTAPNGTLRVRQPTSWELLALIQSQNETIDDLLTNGLSTASSTPLGAPLSLWEKVLELGEAFKDGVLEITGFRSDSVETDLLCVGDVCVTEEEFEEVFGNTGNDTPTGGGGIIRT